MPLRIRILLALAGLIFCFLFLQNGLYPFLIGGICYIAVSALE